MIQAYLSSDKDYSNNGDMVLLPESCTLSAQLNGSWSMELYHPIDEDGRWRYIEEEGIIAAPTFMGDKQLFRVSEVKKSDTEIIATAYPVFFDSADDCFLSDVRPTAKNGQEALDIMMAGSKYTGESNITKVSTAYFERRNLMAAISGEEEPTFRSRWGGEVLYDNFKIIINEHVGGDYGVEARYGKNIVGIEHTLNLSNLVTRIVPVSYNGHTIGGANGYVDSPLADKYAKRYIREVIFDDVKMRADAATGDEERGIVICDTQEELDAALTAKCQEQFDLGADLPEVSLSIDMELLSRTEEYTGYEILETVGLGDTVSCIHDKLGISTPARVIAIEWDCIHDKPGRVELGTAPYDYFREASATLQAVQSVVGPGNTVMAERIQGVLNAINTQLRYQKNVAQKQDVRAILFEDLDPDSPTYGAMCLGTQGFQISAKRTADGRDWDWTTAFTARGGYANTIIAGLLADKTGRNYWNLDTGEFRLSMDAQVGDGEGKTTLQDIVNMASNPSDKLTHEQVFNLLTNDGEIKGIFQKGGQLYINGTYISVEDLYALNATIAGWSISESAIYKDVKLSNGTIYRVYFQPILQDNPEKTWVLSCQKNTGTGFAGVFILYSDGSAIFGNGTLRINADGSASFGKGRFAVDADGGLTWRTPDNQIAATMSVYHQSDKDVYIFNVASGTISAENLSSAQGYTGDLYIQGQEGPMRLIVDRGRIIYMYGGS